MSVHGKVDFLGIGAQKAGTTWLWEMLRHHPQIWMPPVKELHYFDRDPRYPSPGFLAGESRCARLFGTAESDRDFRRICRAQFRVWWQERDWPAMRWGRRYFFGGRDDAWYRSLFKSAAPGQLRGEITPSYSLLDDSDVVRVARFLPGLKIVLLLRDPVERAWSQVRFEFGRKRFAPLDDLDAVRAFIESPMQTQRGDYLRTLGIWETHFSPGQIHVGFYDDITDRPAEMLREILRHLGADPDRLPLSEGELSRRVLASQEAPMPAEIRSHLEAKYRPQIATLAQRFEGPPRRWLAALDSPR